MITLRPLPPAEVARVAHLNLPEAQTDFVGDIADMVSDVDTLTHMHDMTYGDEVVGFFKVDLDFSRTIADLPAGSFGLRGLLIGGQYQGRGHGGAMLAALPDYLRHTYPSATAFWLSVDNMNLVATRCYEKAGWIKTGPQRDGRCGKEHVMRLCMSPG